MDNDFCYHPNWLPDSKLLWFAHEHIMRFYCHISSRLSKIYLICMATFKKNFFFKMSPICNFENFKFTKFVAHVVHYALPLSSELKKSEFFQVFPINRYLHIQILLILFVIWLLLSNFSCKITPWLRKLCLLFCLWKSFRDHPSHYLRGKSVFI